MDNLARRLLIEQTRKEVLDDIKKYQVGFATAGNILTTTSGIWQGYILVIPEEKFDELFKEIN